jgi:hypothetical protein
MYGMGFKYGGGLKRFQDGDEYMPKEDNDLPTPPSNLVNNNQTPYEYDYSNVVENPESFNNSSEFNGWGNSESGKKYSMIQEKYNYNKNPLTTITPSNYNINIPKVQLPKLEPIKTDVSKPAVVKFEDKDFEDEDAVDKRGIKYGWTNADKLNLLNSFINLAGVRKSTPFEPTLKFQRPETRYYDPARELAANTEPDPALYPMKFDPDALVAFLPLASPKNILLFVLNPLVAGLVEYNVVPEVDIDPPPPAKEDVGTATDTPLALPTQVYPVANEAVKLPVTIRLPVNLVLPDTSKV